MAADHTIRIAKTSDWPMIWPIVREVIREGETFAFDPEMGGEEARMFWMESAAATYVIEQGGEIVGSYYIKPNHYPLGAHVCNAGYMVSSMRRGKGFGAAMCSHSLAEARKLGFFAMQFNLVVAVNTNAVALWEKMGFDVIGVLPKAFNHKRLGYVDALVMYKIL